MNEKYSSESQSVYASRLAAEYNLSSLHKRMIEQRIHRNPNISSRALEALAKTLRETEKSSGTYKGRIKHINVGRIASRTLSGIGGSVNFSGSNNLRNSFD